MDTTDNTQDFEAVIKDVTRFAKEKYAKTKEQINALREENPEIYLMGKCFLRGAGIGTCAGLIGRAIPPLALPALLAGMFLAVIDGQNQAEEFIAEQEAKDGGPDLHVV